MLRYFFGFMHLLFICTNAEYEDGGLCTSCMQNHLSGTMFLHILVRLYDCLILVLPNSALCMCALITQELFLHKIILLLDKMKVKTFVIEILFCHHAQPGIMKQLDRLFSKKSYTNKSFVLFVTNHINKIRYKQIGTCVNIKVIQKTKMKICSI